MAAISELLLLLLLVVGCHEGAHWLRLRSFGIWARPAVKWYGGFGWAFDSSVLTSRQRRSVLLVGPLVGAIVWGVLALALPGLRVDLLVLLVADLLANLLIPGSDGWRCWHRPHAREARVTLGG